MKQEYKEILKSAFPLPPCDADIQTEEVLRKYPFYEYNIENKAVVWVLKLGKNIFGVCSMAVKPQFQGQGLGTKLMRLIEMKHTGIIVLHSTKAGKFYEKLGYVNFGGTMYIKRNGYSEKF